MLGVRLKEGGGLDRFFSVPAIGLKEQSAIFLPILAEQAFNTMFGLLNSSMISTSGMAAYSAVTIVDSLNVFLQTLYSSVATGASVVVANYRGQGDKDRLHEAIVQGVLSVSMMSLITTVLILTLNRFLLGLLFGSAEPDVMNYALLYMLFGALSLPFLATTFSMGSVMRGIGEGRIQLIITVTNSCLYLGLNVLFLVVLNMGVPGLIISVSIFRVAGFFISLLFRKIFKSKSRFKFKEIFYIDFTRLKQKGTRLKEVVHFQFNLLLVKKILFVGIPAATENLFFSGGRIIIQSFISPIGTLATAAYSISYQIMMFTQLASMAIIQTLYSLVGICIGKKRVEDIRRITKSYMRLNIGIYVAVFGLFFIIYGPLMNFFHAPDEIKDTIFLLLFITMIVQPLIHSQGFTLAPILRAAGDGVYTTNVSLITMWAFRVGGGFLLSLLFGSYIVPNFGPSLAPIPIIGSVLNYELGARVLGFWLGMMLDWTARGFVFAFRYRGEKWHAKSAYFSKN